MAPNVKAIQVLIADSQFLVTESLKVLLNSERACICKTVESSYELVQLLNKSVVDVLLTDFSRFDYTGFEELTLIKQKHPELPIVILTNSFCMNDFDELSRIGIRNVVYKTADKDELLAALDAALKGKKYYSNDILEMLLEYGERKNRQEVSVQLTITEKEIIRQISAGFTTKEIADKKHISFHTVMTHRKNIFRKLQINSSSELLLYAIKTGLINNLEYQI
jgi:DNA-binding NarL/FixJ family response regulator